MRATPDRSLLERGPMTGLQRLRVLATVGFAEVQLDNARQATYLGAFHTIDLLLSRFRPRPTRDLANLLLTLQQTHQAFMTRTQRQNLQRLRFIRNRNK